MRKEQCFLQYVNNQCAQPMSQDQTRMVCCCSMGQAWGRPCIECPRSGTRKCIQLMFIIYYYFAFKTFYLFA